MQNLIDWVCLSEQIKENNTTIRDLTGEYKKIVLGCRRSHRYDPFLRLASETIILRQCTRNLIFVVIENGSGIIRLRKTNCGGKIWIIGKCQNDSIEKLYMKVIMCDCMLIR